MRRIQMWNDKIYVWVWPTTNKILSRWWFAENNIVCALPQCYGCLIGPCIGYSVVKWSNQHHRNDWTIDPNPNLVGETWTNECVSRTCLRISFWMRATFYHHALHHKCPESWWKNNGNDAVKNGVCGKRIVNCIVLCVYLTLETILERNSKQQQ